MRRIDITLTAAEEEALRRALAGLIADQRAKRAWANRGQTKLHDAADRVFDKIFPQLAKTSAPVRGND